METPPGSFFPVDLLDTTAAERDHLYHVLPTSKGIWALAIRGTPDARAWPVFRPEEQYAFQEVNIFAKIGTGKPYKRIGESLRPRYGAKKLVPQLPAMGLPQIAHTIRR